jgi:D5 N terminal like/Family of unknown function (DUF5906)/Toprim domain
MRNIVQRDAYDNSRSRQTADNPKGFNAATLQIIDFLGGDRSTGKCFCPCHDDGERPSLQVGNGNKVLTIVHCFGEGTKQHDREVIRYLRGKGVLGGLSQNQLDKVEQARTPEDRRKYALRIWEDTKRNRGREKAYLLKNYLTPRAIKEVPDTALLALPIAYTEDDKIYTPDEPAMLLPIRNTEGTFQGFQATWLSGDLSTKKKAEPVRKSYGLVKGNFVSLMKLNYDHSLPKLLIAEGSETAFAAMQLTGLPGVASAGKGFFKDVKPPAADEYIVLIDNDADGGSRTAAGILAQRLVDGGAAVRLAIPEGGDGYDWNDALIDANGDQAKLRGLTDQILQAPLFSKTMTNGDGQVVLLQNAPLVAADEYIKRHEMDEDGIRLLRSYRGAFYRWTGTHWREYSDEKLAAGLYKFLNKAVVASANGDLNPFNPTRSKVDNIVHALRHSVLVSADRATPCWLGGQQGHSRDLVACQNGILNLRTRKLLPHDPRFFSMMAMPLDYDPDAPKPTRFLKFLEELWPTDIEDDEKRAANKGSQRCLMEIIGYLLTSDTSQQKIFLIVGPTRSGKGTIVWVLRKLLGAESVGVVTLRSMIGEFGRWPLIDKTLAVITDARLSPNADAHTVTEHLLSISGGDPQSINRKNQSFWHGLLQVRFLLTSNELPAIADASGTLSSRFILLQQTESFFGARGQEAQE